MRGSQDGFLNIMTVNTKKTKVLGGNQQGSVRKPFLSLEWFPGPHQQCVGNHLEFAIGCTHVRAVIISSHQILFIIT